MSKSQGATGALAATLLGLLWPFCAAVPVRSASECEDWQARKPAWIFCDDFESAGPLVGTGRYFEADDNSGDFRVAPGEGLRGSAGMRAQWQSSEVDAGNLKLGFGRAPAAYFSKGIRAGEDFREVYYRMFVRLQPDWKGNPYKLSRATVMAKADWSQAMIAHLWGDQDRGLQLDPVRCVDAAGSVACSGYNDFDHMKWIGAKAGNTPVFGGGYGGRWLCVETHVKLNGPGRSDGIHEFWIDDTLEARREGLDFVGAYAGYGLNAVFFENYWNSGSPQAQKRWFDNIVVSTERIGCAENLPAPSGLGRASRRSREAVGHGGFSRYGGYADPARLGGPSGFDGLYGQSGQSGQSGHNGIGKWWAPDGRRIRPAGRGSLLLLRPPDPGERP